jgi:hypothetical protein
MYAVTEAHAVQHQQQPHQSSLPYCVLSLFELGIAVAFVTWCALVYLAVKGFSRPVDRTTPETRVFYQPQRYAAATQSPTPHRLPPGYYIEHDRHYGREAAGG